MSYDVSAGSFRCVKIDLEQHIVMAKYIVLNCPLFIVGTNFVL